MLLLLMMVQDFCQLMTCLVLSLHHKQFVMKILMFIAQRYILIKLDGMQHWKISIKKEKSEWTSLACHKCIFKEESSAISERCPRRCHLSCTNPKIQESKSRNWFCKLCTIKFTQKFSLFRETFYTDKIKDFYAKDTLVKALFIT